MIPKYYEIALKDMGIHELPGVEADLRVLEYHKHTTLKATSDEVAWCAASMCCWLEEAGIEGTHSARARDFLKWGEEIKEPIQGCIVVLKRGKNPAQGHVGIYETSKAGLIKVYGGNQHDSVCYAWFPKTDVLSYRIPKGEIV